MTGGAVLSDLQVYAWGVFLLFLRVAGVIALAPVFGERSLPMRLRAMVAFAFTVCLSPALGPLMPSPDLWTAAAEGVTGLCFGLLLRLVVLALQMVGAIAAQSMSLAQVAGGGIVAEPAPAIGNLLTAGGVALAASGGLHVQILGFLMQSYQLVPLGSSPLVSVWAEAGLGSVVRATWMAFSLAMPFVALSLFYNMLLGVMSRAMPQLMVMMIGAPIIVGLSLLALALLGPTLLHFWRDALSNVLIQPERIL